MNRHDILVLSFFSHRLDFFFIKMTVKLVNSTTKFLEIAQLLNGKINLRLKYYKSFILKNALGI